jgi:hypothetical protein
MLPFVNALLMLTVPPSIVTGGSYSMWYSGQQIALQQRRLREAPPSGAAAYGSGLATLAGTYRYYVLHYTSFPQRKILIESEQSKDPKVKTLEKTSKQQCESQCPPQEGIAAVMPSHSYHHTSRPNPSNHPRAWKKPFNA